ncbi:flavodoxin [Butyrivibrio sp. AE3006]|jgi:flavodoxin short chain|uniref:flavodoxin n=1 Tax=Butyrivibrio sp. AE3006 TaxID=1280673 RepID=UPI0003FAC7AC|nr:flavodoxin [Butyrivibrio sp. AE3006]
MSKVAIVFWSGTGNTQSMAEAVKAGAESSGASVDMFSPSEFNSSMVSGYDAIAFGCPAMGAEVLEETEFDPMFSSVEGSLSGKKVVLFGSYGWGDGQWMRDWEDRCKSGSINLVTDSVIANNAPSDDDLENCTALGRAIA